MIRTAKFALNRPFKPSISLGRNLSWFSRPMTPAVNAGLDELGGDAAKLEHIRKVVRSSPHEGILLIEKGWQAGKLPTSEAFAKEYLKAAFALKIFDNVDLNALSLMLNNSTGVAAGATGEAMTNVQIQQLMAATLLRGGNGSSGAGESVDRPLFIQARPMAFKDQMWKVCMCTHLSIYFYVTDC